MTPSRSCNRPAISDPRADLLGANVPSRSKTKSFFILPFSIVVTRDLPQVRHSLFVSHLKAPAMERVTPWERPLVSLTSHESSTWHGTEWIRGRRALGRWSPCGGSNL